MGLGCSKANGVSIIHLLPSKRYEMVSPQNASQSLLDWINEVYETYPQAFVKKTKEFSIIRIQNICERAPSKLHEQAVLYLTEFVCQDYIHKDYLDHLIEDEHLYFMIHIPHKIDSLNTSSSTNTCGILDKHKPGHGATFAFVHTMDFASFKDEYAVIHNLAKHHKKIVNRNPPIIRRVCFVDLVCSNNRGGRKILDYIERCGIPREDYEAVALQSIDTAYMFYAKYGYLRTNDFKNIYPLYYEKSILSRSPKFFYAPPSKNKDVNDLLVFEGDSRYNLLLTKLL